MWKVKGAFYCVIRQCSFAFDIIGPNQMFPRLFLGLLLLTAGSSPLAAQPFVYHRAVVNAASFAPPGIPSGSLARGSIFSIFGRNLGPSASARASTYPLSTTLAGTSIEVCRDTACVAAYPIYTSPSQINAILASDTPLGSATLRVTFNGQPGNFTPIEVVPASVGIFSINSAGFGPGIVQNFIDSSNTPVNSATAAAKPDQFIILWATGLGAALNPDRDAPQPGNLPVSVEVFVGGKSSRVEYSGRAPCCSGLDQIVAVLPTDAPLGCNVPVAIRAGGVVSNDVTLTITSDGRPCAPDALPSATARLAGGRIGRMSLMRSTPTSDPATVLESAFAAFTVESANPWGFHPELNAPPAGTCITYMSRGSIQELSGITNVPPSVRRFDAGPSLSVITDKGTRTVLPRPQNLTGYLDILNLTEPSANLPAILTPGSPARFVVPGGSDLAAFEISITPPPAPQWTNATAALDADRAQALPLTFQAAPAGVQLWIRGNAMDEVADARVNFDCAVPPGVTQFTIPAYVLSRLPSFRQGSGRSAQTLELTVVDAAQRTAPAGLDYLFVSGVSGTKRPVRFR